MGEQPEDLVKRLQGDPRPRGRVPPGQARALLGQPRGRLATRGPREGAPARARLPGPARPRGARCLTEGGQRFACSSSSTGTRGGSTATAGPRSRGSRSPPVATDPAPLQDRLDDPVPRLQAACPSRRLRCTAGPSSAGRRRPHPRRRAHPPACLRHARREARSGRRTSSPLSLQRARVGRRSRLIADLRAGSSSKAHEANGDPPKEMPVPCYFNTGCCSYGDGDVTGLEALERRDPLVR